MKAMMTAHFMRGGNRLPIQSAIIAMEGNRVKWKIFPAPMIQHSGIREMHLQGQDMCLRGGA